MEMRAGNEPELRNAGSVRVNRINLAPRLQVRLCRVLLRSVPVRKLADCDAA